MQTKWDFELVSLAQIQSQTFAKNHIKHCSLHSFPKGRTQLRMFIGPQTGAYPLTLSCVAAVARCALWKGPWRGL